MREIEDELGLWHRRYSSFIRVSPKKQKLALQRMSDDEKPRFQKLSSQVGSVPFIGLRTTTTVITTIFVIGWLALIVREYILTF